MDYFHEHASTSTPDHLSLARLIVEGGWTEDLGVTFSQLFPDHMTGASKEAIAKLERKKYDELEDKDGQCLICLAVWEEKDHDIIKMNCKHLFHSECVSAWLNRAASCPACRDEMPTDDPLFEEYKRQQKRQQEREAVVAELHDSMYG